MNKVFPKLILWAVIIAWIVFGVYRINRNGLTFDDAYNAQVAAHFADTFVYAVEYPDVIPCSVRITTGPTMLLPTAFLYRMFGVSILTSQVIALVYSALLLIAIFKFADFIVKRWTWASLGIFVTFLLASNWVFDLSIVLLGEIAALFFVVASLYNLCKFIEGRYVNCLFYSGMFLAFSLVTKTSQIFMCIVIPVMLLFNVIVFGNIKIKNLVRWLAGFVVGYGIFEGFKFWQLGSLEAYLNNWREQRENIYSQTGTNNFFDRFDAAQIKERWDYLQYVFGLNSIARIVLMLVPFIVIAVLLIKRFTSIAVKRGIIYMISAYGVAADSMLVYYVLFGSSGLTYARRMSVYSETLLICNLMLLTAYSYYAFSPVSWEGEKKLVAKIVAPVLCVIGVTLCIPTIKNSLGNFSRLPEYSVTHEANERMVEFVETLPEDAILYAYDWWQAPEISLMSDLTFKDISSEYNDISKIDFEKSYVIAGYQVLGSYAYDGTFDEYINQLFVTDKIYFDDGISMDGGYAVYRLLGVNEEVEDKVF